MVVMVTAGCARADGGGGSECRIDRKGCFCMCVFGGGISGSTIAETGRVILMVVTDERVEN
jgi:hypothetical protein